MIEHGDLILFFRAAQLLPWSGISQMSREHLEQAAERFFDELNTDHARQIKAAVYSMKRKGPGGAWQTWEEPSKAGEFDLMVFSNVFHNKHTTPE